jgi:hypothetical protein
VSFSLPSINSEALCSRVVSRETWAALGCGVCSKILNCSCSLKDRHVLCNRSEIKGSINRQRRLWCSSEFSPDLFMNFVSETWSSRESASVFIRDANLSWSSGDRVVFLKIFEIIGWWIRTFYCAWSLGDRLDFIRSWDKVVCCCNGKIGTDSRFKSSWHSSGLRLDFDRMLWMIDSEGRVLLPGSRERIISFRRSTSVFYFSISDESPLSFSCAEFSDLIFSALQRLVISNFSHISFNSLVLNSKSFLRLISSRDACVSFFRFFSLPSLSSQIV